MQENQQIRSLFAQEFGALIGLHLSERPDFFRWGRAQIPLVDAGLSRFIWFVWFVLFIWLNQTNRTNQMNQTNQINKTNQTIKVLAYKKAFRSLLGREYTYGK